MESLSADVLLLVLSFLNAAELDSVSLTSRSLSYTSKSSVLWEELCRQTGKTDEADIVVVAPASSSQQKDSQCDFFRFLYHKVPCVPVDFRTIQEALERCRPGTTLIITLQPGVYEGRLVLQRRSVQIRAVDPVQGATLVWYPEPSSCHDPRPNQSLVEVKESCTSVCLRNLTLLHYSEGTDVWDGNCAVYCHGHRTRTCLQECSIQSDSGRGLVVSHGATAVLIRSSIHDCAATGVYVGGHGSSLHMISSNILRNGYGRRPWQDPHQERLRSPGIQEGHSGLYVEGGNAEIFNTLIAENCRTGLTVVRGGSLQLCHNVFLGTGTDHIQVFREEVTEEEAEDDASLGAMYQVSNLFEFDSPTPEEMEATWIRHPSVGHRRLSRNSLLDPDEIPSA